MQKNADASRINTNCKNCSNIYTDQDIETTESNDDYENFDDEDLDIIADEEDLLDNTSD